MNRHAHQYPDWEGRKSLNGANLQPDFQISAPTECLSLAAGLLRTWVWESLTVRVTELRQHGRRLGSGWGNDVVCPMLDHPVTAATSTRPCPSTDACLPSTRDRTSATTVGTFLSAACTRDTLLTCKKHYTSTGMHEPPSILMTSFQGNPGRLVSFSTCSALIDWYELWFYVPFDTAQVISEMFPKPISCFGMGTLNLTQQKHTFTNQDKCTTTQNKHTKN